jgi:hypothetical protein
MLHGGPFVLYALSQIRQQEIQRNARDAWQRSARSEAVAPRRPRPRPVRLDTVAGGC